MPATPFAIGIDLGTSTSEICVFQHEQPQVIADPLSGKDIVPSLVALNRRGELACGKDAQATVDMPGRGVREVKRKMGSGETVPLGDKQYRPEEISATILRHLKDNAEQVLGVTVRDVVISVPANFPDAARQATLNAGQLAGLNVLRIINEPTAAALAFGIRHLNVEEQIVVFDFGGGTLDITVLEMMAGVLDVKSSFGDPQLGGKDFDTALIDLIVSKFQQQHPAATLNPEHRQNLKQKAENAKIELSKSDQALIRAPYFASEAGATIDLEVAITRAEFEAAIAPLLERARVCVRQALAARQLQPSAIDRVLLVGGTTYIPAVRRLVADIFGREPRSDVDPDLAVSIGASIQAAILGNLISEERGLILTDVSPFGLGIDVVEQVGGQYMLVYESLIHPNTTVPYTYKKTYTLLSETQDSIELKLYQDNTGKAQLPEQAQFTGIAGAINDIPPSPTGRPHQVEVEFTYDTNQTAHLTAHLPATGQRLQLAFEATPMRMDDAEKDEALQNVKDLWKNSSKAREYESMISKAERLEAELSSTQRQELVEATSDLKMALASNDEASIEAAGERLIDRLFDLENPMGG